MFAKLLTQNSPHWQRKRTSSFIFCRKVAILRLDLVFPFSPSAQKNFIFVSDRICPKGSHRTRQFFKAFACSLTLVSLSKPTQIYPDLASPRLTSPSLTLPDLTRVVWSYVHNGGVPPFLVYFSFSRNIVRF